MFDHHQHGICALPYPLSRPNRMLLLLTTAHAIAAIHVVQAADMVAIIQLGMNSSSAATAAAAASIPASAARPTS
jgi:hypothetical protein